MMEERKSLKRFLVFALILLVPAVVGVVKTSGQADVTDEEKSAGGRWEYLVVAGPATTNFTPTGNPNMRKEPAGTFGREGFVLEQHMDKLGAKGWELVAVAGLDRDPVYYFKRRR